MLDKFINKLYDTNNKLSLLLLEAKHIAENYNSTELITYIDKEINGYKIEDGLPDYRKIRAQIVVDIKNIYGELTHTEHFFDFSLLSEKIGFDLDDSYVPDGISFLETSLKGISGQKAIKPIPKPLVKMLDETFHYNNKFLHIVAAYHKIPKASLEYILIKVRQNLIQDFQILLKKHSTDNEEIKVSKIENELTLGKDEIFFKKVFVSYAWEDEEHNSKIISFVDFLRKKGFDASMDKKDSQKESAVNFNKLMVNGIQNSDKVIVVLSKNYKLKADGFEGGVWQELNMIIEDMKNSKNKYIFVHFGKNQRIEVTPTVIAGIDILDLKKDQDENNFNLLFAKIKEENIIEFSEVSKEEVLIKKTEIKPFKL